MLKLVLSSVRHNLGRYIATLVAIVAGVGFFTAVSVVSDGVISSLDGNVDQQYGTVSVAVGSEDSESSLTSSAQLEPLKLPASIGEKIADLPDVAGTAGVLTAPVSFAGDDGAAFATSATGRLWVTDDELNPIDVVEGDAPTAAGEVAVDQGMAEEYDLAVGDSLPLLTLAGEQPVTISGITAFGDSDSLDDGGTVSITQDDAFAWLGSGEEEYDQFYARGSGTETDLAQAAAGVLPDGFEAQTGDDFREDQRQTNGQFAQFLKRGLQAFAVLALLVGGFVIFNTFSVIVAQRLRELAVLAAIGATPRQLKRSLRLEGAVLGVVGSLLGVAAGYLLTLLLQGALAAFDQELPGGLTFSVSNVVAGVLLGTIITVLSVMSPARRAGRTEPMEALRSAAVESPTLGRFRGLVSLVLVVAGLAAMLAGSGLALIGAGGVAIAAGVFVGAPFLARVAARVVRPLLERFGIEGRLAVDNSVRNPKRTATTANALLIGVFLVTFVAVSGASLRDYVVDAVEDTQSADYLLFSEGGSVDDALVADVEAVDDVEGVVPFARQAVTIDGTVSAISAGDLDQIREISAIRADDGSLDDLATGPSIALLDDGTADMPGVGDTVKVQSTSGKPVELTVAALLVPNQDSAQTGAFVSPETLTSVLGQSAPTAAFVDLADGASDKTKDAVQAVADRRPDITAIEGNVVGELIRTIMNFLIQAVTGLLLMSVVIALIGIVNTMSLSILERRRELGLLRIIGMTDKRVRRMVRLESVLISLLGTISGLVLGLVLSLLTVSAINRSGEAEVAVSVPWIQMVAIVLLGVVLGIVAALLPSRRSTRLDVLDAVAAS